MPTPPLWIQLSDEKGGRTLQDFRTAVGIPQPRPQDRVEVLQFSHRGSGHFSKLLSTQAGNGGDGGLEPSGWSGRLGYALG